MTPLFGCICPNSPHKKKCDRVYNVVYNNSCLGEFNVPHPANSESSSSAPVAFGQLPSRSHAPFLSTPTPLPPWCPILIFKNQSVRPLLAVIAHVLSPFVTGCFIYFKFYFIFIFFFSQSFSELTFYFELFLFWVFLLFFFFFLDKTCFQLASPPWMLCMNR